MKIKKLSAGVLALALSVGAVAPSVSSLVATSYAAEATASIADHKTNVVLHKFYNDDEGYTITGNEIENPRGKADFEVPEDLKAYGTEAQEKYGLLGFTIYKLTDKDGKTPAIADFNETGTAKVNEDNTEATVNGETYKLTPVGEEQELDENGQITFEGQENGSYVIIETKRPTTYVLKRSQDLFLSLPIANDEGNGFKDEIHLSPKNEVEQRNFIFTKYLNGKGEDKVLEGVTFQLYKGEKGSGEPVGEPQTTNAQGKIEIVSPSLGNYYLVETDVPDTPEGKDYELYISPFAKNDENNRLTFTITGDTAVENYNAEFINYERPDASKEVNDGRHEDAAERDEKGVHASKGNHRHNFNKGDAVPFIQDIDVPYDVMGGESTISNGEERFNQPAGRMYFKDIPGEKLEIKPGEKLSDRLDLKLEVAGDPSVELVEGTDYIVKENGTGFEIDFIVKDYNFTAYDGAETQKLKTVSEKVANAAGGKIITTYKMNLKQDALPDEIIENDMTFVYNNSPGLEEDLDYIVEDKDNVETYGKKFIKTGTGNLGFLEDADNTIEGAKFYVYRTHDGYNVEGTGTKEERTNVDLEGRQYLLVDSEGNQSWSETIKEVEGEYKVPEGALEVESTEDGTFEVTGLEAGTYYLEEFYAPEGWQISNKDHEFELKHGSYEGEEAVVDHVVNRKDTFFTSTGGTFIVIGIAGVAVAGSVFGYKKFNKKEEETIVIE